LNQSIINDLCELEQAAAQQWWHSEDRLAWRDELLRACELRQFISIRNCLNGSTPLIPVRVWDSDLDSCFSIPSAETEDERFFNLISELENLEKDNALAIALRPGFWVSDSWPEHEEALRTALLKARAANATVVRCGFLCEQAEILMTAELGFTAIQLHASELDIFELQLLVELARDCKLTPIVSIENEKQLETVLGTDAPHILLCCLKGSGYEAAVRFVQQALPRLPEACSKLLLTSQAGQADVQLFRKLGMQGILNFR
jgi:hypothetical protein